MYGTRYLAHINTAIMDVFSGSGTLNDEGRETGILRPNKVCLATLPHMRLRRC